MLIGITLAKNIIKYNYPLKECILQHKNLFDMHYFVVPLPEQDEDGTLKLIKDTCKENEINGRFFHVNWPTKLGFQGQSVDKIYQKLCVDEIEKEFKGFENIWICKNDADEFIHEKYFNKIKGMIKFVSDSDITEIGLNYIQTCGSLKYKIFDPTEKTVHIFKIGSGGYFPGNDAMNIKTNGECLYLDDVYILHIGYVKSKEILTQKIKEHLILNSNVYTGLDQSIVDKFTFEFPSHKPGSRLWPLGIAVIKGEKNETEYIKLDVDELPWILRENIDKYDYYIPNH